MNKLDIIKVGIALAIATIIIAIFVVILYVSHRTVPLGFYYLIIISSLISAGTALASIFPLRKHIQTIVSPSNPELTREGLSLEEKRLELAERSLNLEKARANYTLEMAYKLTNTLPSEVNTQAREKLPEDVIKQLIQLQQIIRLQQIEDRRLSLEAIIKQLIQLQQIEDQGMSQSKSQGNKEAVPEE